MSQKVDFKKSENKLQNDSTPQFPFIKAQIYFHFIFISFIVLVGIYNYHIYVQQNLQNLIQVLSESWITKSIQTINNFTQKKFSISQLINLKLLRYSNDPQWQAYRSNIYMLFILALIWRFITYIYELIDRGIIQKTKRKNYFFQQKQILKNKFTYINKYIFVLSLVFLLFAFRADIIFYMAIIFSWWAYVQLLLKLQMNRQNFLIFKNISIKKFNQISILNLWIIVLLALYLNQKLQHFRFFSIWFEENIIPQFLSPLKNSYRAIHCSQLLNITFLRLLSYAIDRIKMADNEYIEKQNQLRTKKFIKCEQGCQVIKLNTDRKLQIEGQEKQNQIVLYCQKGRDHILKQKHSFMDYINYSLFTPLMLTGPPISYNNYFSFSIYSSPKLTLKQILYYLFLLFAFQLYQHFLPVISPTPSMTLIQMQVFSLLHLMFIWFKFLIIWRTAKIWAKLYSVDVIDNMSRCICNNYGFQGFWRMWHRGFNHWLIRYLYIPLGGNNNILSVLCVVAFVAFWHDHTLNIVFWALIISLFMIPEILIKRYFRKNKKNLFNKFWFKYLACFASSIYIYFLIICNLIGFGYGLDKTFIVLDKLKNNIPDLIFSIFTVMNAVMLMFYQRNLQKNKRNF